MTKKELFLFDLRGYVVIENVLTWQPRERIGPRGPPAFPHRRFIPL